MRSNKLIEKVLLNFPDTRNSDRQLILKVWEIQGLFLSETQKNIFSSLMSSETIRRTRQRFQAKGQYLASDEVSNARRYKSYEVTQNAPTASPERLSELVEQTRFI